MLHKPVETGQIWQKSNNKNNKNKNNTNNKVILKIAYALHARDKKKHLRLLFGSFIQANLFFIFRIIVNYLARRSSNFGAFLVRIYTHFLMDIVGPFDLKFYNRWTNNNTTL